MKLLPTRQHGKLAKGLGLALMLGIGSGVAQAATVKFNTGGSFSGSGFGNTFTTTGSDGTTVTANGYSFLSGSSNATTAQLEQWAGGLGSCNQQEGTSCPSGPHSVDNKNGVDFILVLFSETVILDSAMITIWDPENSHVDGDSDISYWTGTGAPTLTLGALGAPTDIDGPFINQGDSYMVNLLSGPADWLLIGASLSNEEGYKGYDGFKLKSIDYAEDAPPIPLPPAVFLFGTGLLGLLGVARRSNNS